MAAQGFESWQSGDYAKQWASDDVIADMLELPREISVALVADFDTAVRHVVDLGSGPGRYLEVFLSAFPGARGTWVDSSDAMRELAEQELADLGERVDYVIGDVERVAGLGLESAEVVVSSRVLHHFSPASLERVYRDVHELLVPGGLFFNLDHVGMSGDWESRYRRVRDRFTGTRRRKLAPHRHDHPLAPLDAHLGWARDAGFETPHAAWRMFHSALVVARRPA